MQPVTASVPASARARVSASAVAACSTSAAASSTSGGAKASRLAAHEHHDRLDLAALGERQQQRAADLAGLRQPRDARREPCGVGGQEAAAGARDPAHAGRALGAREQVAEPSDAIEHVHGDELLVAVAVGAEVVDVHLVGARHRQQLAREHAEDRVRVAGPVGQRGQVADAGEQATRCPQTTTRYPYP